MADALFAWAPHAPGRPANDEIGYEALGATHPNANRNLQETQSRIRSRRNFFMGCLAVVAVILTFGGKALFIREPNAAEVAYPTGTPYAAEEFSFGFDHGLTKVERRSPALPAAQDSNYEIASSSSFSTVSAPKEEAPLPNVPNNANLPNNPNLRFGVPKRFSLVKWLEEHTIVYNIAISIALILFAGFASGMTVGLLSVDAIQLKVLSEEGTDAEKEQALELEQTLSNHHLLLVTLLLANSIAMEALPLFLNKTVPEWAAVVLSVTAILAFGEVLPQALCTGRYQIPIVMQCLPLVNFLVYSLYMISWPIAKLLDAILGHSEQTFYARSHLKALIRLHQKENRADHERSNNTSAGEGEVDSALGADEVVVIEGALDLATKHVAEIMVPWHKVYMLEWHTPLTHELKLEILNKGHSRIPVYRKHRHNICGVLLVKSLIVPPSTTASGNLFCPTVGDCVAKRTTGNGSVKPPPIFCEPTLQLYDLLNDFQRGRHLAFITRSPTFHQEAWERNRDLAEEDLDDSKRFIGIATLEDVIEELIQEEIYDEFDHYASVAFPPVGSATARILPPVENAGGVHDPNGSTRLGASVAGAPSNDFLLNPGGQKDLNGLHLPTCRELVNPVMEPIFATTAGPDGKVVLAARATRKVREINKGHPAGPQHSSGLLSSITLGQLHYGSTGDPNNQDSSTSLKHSHLGRRLLDARRPLMDDQQTYTLAGAPGQKLASSMPLADLHQQSQAAAPLASATQKETLYPGPSRQPSLATTSTPPTHHEQLLPNASQERSPSTLPACKTFSDGLGSITCSAAGGNGDATAGINNSQSSVDLPTTTITQSSPDGIMEARASDSLSQSPLKQPLTRRGRSSVLPVPNIFNRATQDGGHSRCSSECREVWSADDQLGYHDGSWLTIASRVQSERLVSRVRTAAGIAARKQLNYTTTGVNRTPNSTSSFTTAGGYKSRRGPSSGMGLASMNEDSLMSDDPDPSGPGGKDASCVLSPGTATTTTVKRKLADPLATGQLSTVETRPSPPSSSPDEANSNTFRSDDLASHRLPSHVTAAVAGGGTGWEGREPT